MICFHGMTGLGKTLTLKSLLSYARKRKFFPGGMMYFNLRTVKTIDLALKTIYTDSLKKFTISGEKKEKYGRIIGDNFSTIQFIEDMINGK